MSDIVAIIILILLLCKTEVKVNDEVYKLEIKVFGSFENGKEKASN